MAEHEKELFDPHELSEMETLEVHMDKCPLYKALSKIKTTQATGRMTIEDSAGENHMYFMQGRPVGVQTSRYLAPLGQLLLERDLCDAPTFIKAQRQIRDGGGLLPGQVFMSLGVINEDQLKDILIIQSSRKARHFCSLGGRSFIFGKGLTFLTGFQSSPMNLHMLVYLAVAQQMSKPGLERFLHLLQEKDVRLRTPGESLLPAEPSIYGFGLPETRFLKRLKKKFQPVWELLETGTLLREDTAIILRYLQIEGLLDIRKGEPKPETPAEEERGHLFAEERSLAIQGTDKKAKNDKRVKAAQRAKARPKTSPRKKMRRLEALPSDLLPLVVAMPHPPKHLDTTLASIVIAPQLL